MNFRRTNNHKHRSIARFSSSDNLMSLLRSSLLLVDECPPPSLCPPLSFEDPFEDPSMEPRPVKSEILATGFYDIKASSSTKGELNQDFDDIYLSQDLFDILDSVVDTTVPKRGLDELIADHEHASSPAKRQRTSSPTAVLAAPYSSEEITARFRPYQEQQWQAQFHSLIQFKLKHGHCCVPLYYPEAPVLARWVKRQRYQYKKFNDGDVTSTMTQHRINELESVGFVWHSHMAAWYEKFNELNAFKQRNGHCNVPSKYAENVALSTWVKCQRRQFKLFASRKSSSMTIERIQELKSLGFAFNGRQQKSTLSPSEQIK